MLFTYIPKDWLKKIILRAYEITEKTQITPMTYSRVKPFKSVKKRGEGKISFKKIKFIQKELLKIDKIK